MLSLRRPGCVVRGRNDECTPFLAPQSTSSCARHRRLLADSTEVHAVVPQAREVFIQQEYVAPLGREELFDILRPLQPFYRTLEVVPQAEPPFLETIQANVI